MNFKQISNIIIHIDTVMQLVDAFKKTAIVCSSDEEVFDSFVKGTIKHMEKHMDMIVITEEGEEDE